MSPEEVTPSPTHAETVAATGRPGALPWPGRGCESIRREKLREDQMRERAQRSGTGPSRDCRSEAPGGLVFDGWTERNSGKQARRRKTENVEGKGGAPERWRGAGRQGRGEQKLGRGPEDTHRESGGGGGARSAAGEVALRAQPAWSPVCRGTGRVTGIRGDTNGETEAEIRGGGAQAERLERESR